MSNRIWRALNAVIWSVAIVMAALIFYVNWYMPHGPMIDTGDVVCSNDDRGPCGEKYIEDTRQLNIPEWAKFLRTSEADLLLMGLFLAGIVVGNRPEGGYKSELN